MTLTEYYEELLQSARSERDDYKDQLTGALNKIAALEAELQARDDNPTMKMPLVGWRL